MVDLSAGAAIREDALSVADACCCQCTAAAPAAASTTTTLAFLRLLTFRTGMIILELATTVTIFYLSMQSPAPASSLAEPPPAASPQLGRWICQQGMRSATIRCLLPVSAAGACCHQCCSASAAASTTTALAFLRLVTFRTVVLPYFYCYGFSRHGIRATLCLGTSSYFLRRLILIRSKSGRKIYNFFCVFLIFFAQYSSHFYNAEQIEASSRHGQGQVQAVHIFDVT